MKKGYIYKDKKWIEVDVLGKTYTGHREKSSWATYLIKYEDGKMETVSEQILFIKI